MTPISAQCMLARSMTWECSSSLLSCVGGSGATHTVTNTLKPHTCAAFPTHMPIVFPHLTLVWYHGINGSWILSFLCVLHYHLCPPKQLWPDIMYRLARGQFQDSSPPLKHKLEAVVTKAGDEPGDEARSVSSPHRLITQTLGPGSYFLT